ncbi:MAG: DsbA family protein [Patescibacteria group bacterium]|nr:DsbA family protein [Patescibacteria group bacterium]
MAPAYVKIHWFKTWWGITIIAFLCFLIAAALAFTALIFNYWKTIKSGQGALLQQKFGAQYGQAQTEDPAVVLARKELETADDPYLGNATADTVIVEFSDFKCPICKAEAPVLQQLAGKYGYKIKIIVRDFAMESVHTGASRLAEVASCANEQGGYWLFSDYFFANQDSLGADFNSAAVDRLVDEYGLDKSKMRNCLETGRGRIEASKDYTDGYKNGVSRGTPTFFVNGHKLEGFVSLETWEKVFKEAGI